MSATIGADWQNRLGQGPVQDLHWFAEDAPVARLAVTLAGMANVAGGRLVLGVSLESGQILGINHLEETLDRLFQAALLVDPPLELPVPLQQTVQGRKVLSVIVPPGLPHVYSVDGRYWGRQGAQTNPLSARRLRQLLLEHGAVQFESRIVPEVTWDDLDPVQIQAYLDQYELIFHDGILFQSSSFSWIISDSSLNLEYDTAIRIIYKRANLTCGSKKDTSVIRNTIGVFHPETQEWKGQKGRKGRKR